MKKNKIVSILALGLILSPFSLLKAEEVIPAVTSESIKDVQVQKNIDIIKNAKDLRKNIIEDSKDKKDIIIKDFQDELKTIKDSTSLSVEEKTAKLKELRDKKFEEIKTERETTIDNLKANIEKKVEDLKTNIEARKTEFNKNIAIKKDEIRKKLEAKAQDRVKATLEKVYSRLNDKIQKISEIDAKILAKISAMEVDGTNVVAMKTQYTNAKASLDKAIIDLNATKTISIDQTSIATSKETFRTLVKTVEDSIKNAGEEYRKIIRLLNPITETKVETNTTPTSN